MMKKFFTLAFALVTIIFVSTSEAGIVTDRLPFQCYVDHQVDTYNQPNGQRVGYISPNVDLIRVTQVRGDGWAYGDYPGRNGRVSHWFRITDICADPSYSNRGTNVKGEQKVFRNRNSYEPFGKVLNNEEVIVLADNGNRAQIIYRLDNGTGYKIGWVPSSSVSSRNVQLVVPTPTSNTVTISDGWYRIQPMHDLGRSADALGTPIGNGNNIHMWTTADIPQQKFYLQNRGNGYFSLQSNYGNKLFVTADGRGNGANLYTSDWKNSDSQLFRLVNAGNNSYHVFSKVGVNLNFDCAGAGRGDGTNLQLWTSENNDWHKWRFTKVSVNSGANFQLTSYSLSSPANYQLRFTGRLWNANNSSEITGVHVYIGGGVGAGGQFLGEFRADKTNHNFDSTLNVPQNRTGDQLVVIYAVNGVESKELDRRNVNIQGNNPTPSGNFIYPVEGNTTITTLFYYENKSRALGHKHSVWWHPYEGGYFNALDISCPKGTPVKAVASGKVSNEYSTNSSNIIVIEHNDSQIGKSLYAHLDEKLVKPGDIIYAGQIIGKSGDKGASWTDTNGVLHHAYHLHMEWFNSSPWEYYRDKVSFRYSISTLNAYNKWVKTLKEANQQDKEKFEAAINWVNNYPKNNGGFRY